MANMFHEIFINIASNLYVRSDQFETNTSKLEAFTSSMLDNHITKFNIPAMKEETLKMTEILLHGKARGPDDNSVQY